MLRIFTYYNYFASVFKIYIYIFILTYFNDSIFIEQKIMILIFKISRK